MRKYLIALSRTVVLASAGTAFAQSQQGGHLGLNSGAGVAASPSSLLKNPSPKAS